jgi:membrane protease YdiL (CAAX protease family)
MTVKAKNILLIFGSSVLLACAVIIPYILYPEESNGLLGDILIAIWAFSIITAMVFFFRWLNKQSFEFGFVLGFGFGLSGLVIILLIAPVLMVRFYVDEYKKQSKKTTSF